MKVNLLWRIWNLYLWPSWPRPHVVARLNTVDLHGDLDDVELVMAIEDEFGIAIEDSEAEITLTVGQLNGLVATKTGQSQDRVWPKVMEITRRHSNCDAPIDEATTFFAKYAQARKASEPS